MGVSNTLFGKFTSAPRSIRIFAIPSSITLYPRTA
ncbi:CRPV-011 [Crowpox virus]|nr:CRPV-011 [Crowpox virus]